MERRQYQTEKGCICYWHGEGAKKAPALVFLAGLTADHHLFDKQIEALEGEYTLLTWDAPAHGESRPFKLEFSLMDKARWLHEILQREGIQKPILIGQSMGGYVAQCYIERYPNSVGGFICIDSAPLQRQYMTGWELWLLKRMYPVYKLYPWRWLVRDGANGCAETAYGKALMKSFIESYDKESYCRLAGHGFRILAEAVEADLPYDIDCPALLLCGEKDKAGSAKSYNRRWTKQAGIPLIWLKNAGHNSNTDCPEQVNEMISNFANSLADSVISGQ